MMIAYDLRYASDHFAGIGTHAYALLEALLELPGKERYRVLWNPSLEQSRFDFSSIRRHPRVEWEEHGLAPLGLRDLLRLSRWLNQRGADVYLSPYYLKPPGARCPSVLTIHDVHPLRFRGEMGLRGEWFYRLALAHGLRARFIVTGSEFSRRELVEKAGARPERVRVTRLGIPPARRVGPPQRPEGLPEGRFSLVVGDNRPRKNLRTLVRAWALLGKDPPLALVWAGRAVPGHPALKRIAEEEGAALTTSLGWIPSESLDWLYDHAEFMMFPSRYEGFGFPLAEALSRGVPALVSDIPPFREIGEGAARFVGPDDPGAWAAAIEQLARDSERREAMREAGLRAASRLTYEQTARETLDLLHDACG